MKDTSSIRLWLPVLLAMFLPVQGCDFFRTLAGRPVGSDLEVLKAERAAEDARIEKQRQARAEDSLRRLDALRDWKSDSAAVAAAMAEGRAVFKRVSELSVVPAGNLDNRFYLMMGYFNNRANVDRLSDRMKADGLAPVMIPFTSGASGVALFPCDSASEVLSGLESVREKDYLPSDSWIIWNTAKYNIDYKIQENENDSIY